MGFTVGQSLTATITKIVDAAGNPTTLQSVPVWTTSDPTILTVTAAVDGLSAHGTPAKVGTVTITATAGPADNNIAGSASVPVTDVAASFQVTVTTP